MFCIKCGMMLNDSAKSCPACGTKVVFPEGFVPEQNSSPKTEIVTSNEPPNVPDNFDLSKANISYNGKTILITDEPEIDLDMTMAAPIPKFSAPVATEPVYQQPAYTAPVYNAPSYIQPTENAVSDSKEAEEVSEKKSKLPLIIAIASVALVVILIAVFAIVSSQNDKDDKKDNHNNSISQNINGGQSIKDETKPSSTKPDKTERFDPDCEVITTVAHITHYVVINPNASDYNEIRQRIDNLNKTNAFEQIFKAPPDTNTYYVESHNAELVCYIPDGDTYPLGVAGGLVLAEKPNTEIRFETLTEQYDAIDRVAVSDYGTIALISADRDAYLRYQNVELIPVYTDEIVIACEIGEANEINLPNAKIGILSSSTAYRYATAINSYEGMGYREEQFVVFDKEEDMVYAIENGEIDCIFTDKNHSDRIALNKSESVADIQIDSEIEPESTTEEETTKPYAPEFTTETVSETEPETSTKATPQTTDDNE